MHFKEKFKSRLPKRAGSAIDVNAARRAQTRVTSSIDASAARRARARAVIASTINSTLPRKNRAQRIISSPAVNNGMNCISSDDFNLKHPPALPPANVPPENFILCNSSNAANERVNDENVNGNSMSHLECHSNGKVVESEFIKPSSLLPPDVTDRLELTNGSTNEAKLTPKSFMKSGASTTTPATPAYVAQDGCDSASAQQPAVPTANLIAVTPISNVKSGTSNGLSTTGTMNGKTASSGGVANRNGQNVIDLLTASPDDPVSSLTSTADSLKYCNSIINPVIDQLTSSASTLKMLTKLIEKQTSNVVMELVPKLMPKLVAAYDSPDIAVRKGAVFAMVAIYKSVGEASIAPYLTSLTGSKMKLLKLYIERSGPLLTAYSNSYSNSNCNSNSNSTTAKNQSTTSTSATTITTTTTNTTAHPAPAQAPISSAGPAICPGNNDTNDH